MSLWWPSAFKPPQPLIPNFCSLLLVRLACVSSPFSSAFRGLLLPILCILYPVFSSFSLGWILLNDVQMCSTMTYILLHRFHDFLLATRLRTPSQLMFKSRLLKICPISSLLPSSLPVTPTWLHCLRGHLWLSCCWDIDLNQCSFTTTDLRDGWSFHPRSPPSFLALSVSWFPYFLPLVSFPGLCTGLSVLVDSLWTPFVSLVLFLSQLCNAHNADLFQIKTLMVLCIYLSLSGRFMIVFWWG